VQRSGENPDQTWRRRAVKSSVGSPSSKVRKVRAGQEAGRIRSGSDPATNRSRCMEGTSITKSGSSALRGVALTNVISDPSATSIASRIRSPRPRGRSVRSTPPQKGPRYVERVTRGVRESASRGSSFPSSSPLEGNTSTRGLSGRCERIRGGRSRRSGVPIALELATAESFSCSPIQGPRIHPRFERTAAREDRSLDSKSGRSRRQGKRTAVNAGSDLVS